VDGRSNVENGVMWRALPLCLVCAGAIAGAATSALRRAQPQTVLSLSTPIEAFA
jgi:hypothetical protein